MFMISVLIMIHCFQGKLSQCGFSWFTHSQLELCNHVSSVRENFSANDCKATVVKRIGSQDKQENKLIHKIKSNPLLKSLLPTEDKSKVMKNDRTKPKGPPPPPPPQVKQVSKQTIQDISAKVYHDDVEDDDADIPKTGFDFLDNW